MTYIQIITLAYIAYLVIMSLITLIMFCKDKNMAVKNGGPERIKEKTLLGLTCFGGAIGAFVGRIVAHHKTNKGYFSFTIYLSLLLQITVLCLMLAKLLAIF